MAVLSVGGKNRIRIYLHFGQCRITDPIDRKAGALMEYLLEGSDPLGYLGMS